MSAVDERYYKALRSLGDDAAFTPTPLSDKTLLNLFHFDQSNEERLSHAKALNSPDVYARYEADLFPADLKALFTLYQRLGAPDFRSRAHLHFGGRSETLARTVFQRAVLGLVIGKDGKALLDEAARSRGKSDPKQQELGRAIERILAAGVSEKDLALVVGEMQYHALFYLCHLIDYPSTDVPECEAVKWRLFEVDNKCAPLRRVDSLATNLYSYFESLRK